MYIAEHSITQHQQVVLLTHTPLVSRLAAVLISPKKTAMESGIVLSAADINKPWS